MTILRSTCSILTAVLAATYVSAQAPRPAATAAPAAASAAAVSASPEKVRTEYNAIVSHLDPGGELMVVANTDGVIEDLVETVRGIAQALPATGESAGNAIVAALNRLPAFIRASGLYAVDGVGLSVVPRTDGLNDLKMFVYRDPAAAQLPFWLGTIGGAPKRLATLDYLPADTVLLRSGTGDPRQFWKFIGDAVRQVGGPDAAKSFDQVVAEGGKNVGTNLNTLIASLDTEQFFSLQLSTTQTMQVPLPGAEAGQEALTIPVPSLLAGCAVRDATLSATLLQALQRAQLPVLRSTNGATTLYTVNVPVPLPFPLTPTFAVHKNMFLLGSTLEIVKNAISAADGPGAHLPAGFAKAFEGAPKLNNGLGYIDRRFSETVYQVQTQLMKQNPGSEVFQQLIQRQQHGQAALVFLNEKDGISIRGTTSQSGKQMILGMTVAPIAMVSAIAIPSFLAARAGAMNGRGSARVSAQNSACINNLRLIDHAKQQWATALNKADTDKPTEKDLAQYFKGGRMPVCPQGGTYSINAVGEVPTCTHEGHELPE